MPVYEFQCDACGKTTEKITIYSEAQRGFNCTRCEGQMKLVMSAANFVTDETRARRILSRGRDAKGMRGRK